MANFIGTGSNDEITPDKVSTGVTRDPVNSRPGGDNDSASGGFGNDTIVTAGGFDTLNGDDGRDRLDGGNDNDVLNGGVDNDTLIGGGGDDNLTGGEGVDTYVFAQGFGSDIINPAGTLGRDVIKFDAAIDREKVKFRVENDDLIITVGDNSIFVNNQYAGGTGQSAEVSELQFGKGADIDLSKPDAAWLLRLGTNLGESITGSIFNDTVEARNGNDSVFVGAGNDVVTAGSGDDFIDGGIGNDRFIFGPGFGRDTVREFFDSGKDVVQFLEGVDQENLTFLVQGSSLIIRRGDNQLVLENQYFNGTKSNARIETIEFDKGPDLDIRKVQDDWLVRTGKSAFERFDGSIFKDTIDGGGGNDTISTIDGNDLIAGGKGDDQLSGGVGNDVYVFDKGFGADFIFEGFNSGKDAVSFGQGIKLGDLDFQVQNTNLVIELGGSRLTLQNQYSNGTGINSLIEKIDFDNGSSIKLGKPLDEWLVVKGTSANDTLGGSVFGDTIDGGKGDDNVFGGNAGRDDLKGDVGDDTLNGGTDVDTIDGGAGNDSILAGDGGDDIVGGTGADTIFGDVGDDTILGGEGADSIDGGTDQNVIEGGTGNDTMTAGVGGDTFVFNQGDGSDVITQFNVGKDVLKFEDFGPKFDTKDELLAAADQRGDDVVINIELGGDRVITVALIGIDVDDLSRDNFLI